MKRNLSKGRLRIAMLIIGIGLFVLNSTAVCTGELSRTRQEEVTIVTDKKKYASEKLEINVTIDNNLHSSITTLNMQGFCSILRLERRDEKEWNEIRNCTSKAPVQLITLEPRSKTIVRLPVSLPYTPISMGMYRVTLVFAIGNEYWGKQHFISHSNEFMISEENEE